MTINDFGHVLAALRSEKRLTINDISQKSGLSGAYISNLERNKRQNPSRSSIKKLADALSVSHEYLLQAAGYAVDSHDNEPADLYAVLKNRPVKYKGSLLTDRQADIIDALIDELIKGGRC